MTAALAYAFGLGFVAAVNPCGFPLLPAYLAFFARADRSASFARRTSRAVASSAAVTIGFVVVFGILGVVLAGALQLVSAWIPWIVIGFGIAMIVGAVLRLTGRRIPLRLPAPGFRNGTSIVAAAGFGVAYAIASISCALPLFVIAVAGTLGAGSGLLRGATFLAYAVGMGVFILACSLVGVHAGAGALRPLRQASRFIPVVSSVVVGVVGAYLVFYWVSDLVAPLNLPPVILATQAIASGVGDWLSVWAFPLACAVLLALVITLITVGRRPRITSTKGSRAGNN
jgi:cytochrome c biogenesis protein CcdA